MLDIRTAYTVDINHPERVAAQIAEEVRAETLGGDYLGVVTCSWDFIQSGTLEAVCSRLPCPVVGIQTIDSAVERGRGGTQLSLMLLGGEGVTFSRALSDPLTEEPEKRLKTMCRRGMTVKTPVMAFVFAPMLDYINDERIVSVVDAETGGTPLFGTLSVDFMDGGYVDSRVVYDGIGYSHRACIVYMYGPAEPSFVMASLPKHRVLRQRDIITRSSNNIIMEVNELPVMVYLDDLGLVRDDQIPGLHSIPFIVDDLETGESESRSVMGLTPEGYVICGGEMREGMALSLGAQDTDSVLETAGRVVDAIEAREGVAGVMLFSCHSRSLALGLEVTAELRYVQERLRGRVPLLMAYSGGEICPVEANNEYRNMSHSDTLVACIL